MDCLLVRYGEISLKSDFVRAEFERLLMQNIAEAMVRNGFHVEKIVKHGARIYVFSRELEKAIKVLKDVFGIVSLSPTYIIKNDIEEFKNWALKIYKKEAGKNKKSFRITGRRQDKNFPLDSTEIGRVVGEYVFETAGAPVDLKEPEININFEVASDATYVFSRTERGWAGLPIGSQGRVICLYDGSKEAILSIFEMMRRGCYITVLSRKKTGFGNLAALAKNYYMCDEKLRIYISKEPAETVADVERANAVVAPLWFEKIGKKEIKKIEECQGELPLFTPLISLTKTELTKRYKLLRLKATKAEKFIEIY
jgi:adenylyl- and sulfurtransferase ThiI